jgi:hypothetical protein
MSTKQAREQFTQPARKSENPLRNGRKESEQRAMAIELNTRGLPCAEILKRLFGIPTRDDEDKEPPAYWTKPSDNRPSPGEMNRRLRELRMQWLVEVLKEHEKASAA